jgi:hypothetical protein
MFPKLEQEYTVRTERGGAASLVAYGLIALLAFAETIHWMGQNAQTNEHVAVDTSLGKRMRVNLNITFPSLACEDLHVDVMDVAGDSQLDVENTMVKKRFNRKGFPIGAEEAVDPNLHQYKQEEREMLQSQKLPDDYCGPCYGAHETEDQCCNTCDELIAAYQKKQWRVDIVTATSEQCVREGKDRKIEPKRMKKGEGGNLSGYFMVNRVGGNFHIAMGEGIERDGRHIHTFNPDDTENFNASHVIHNLSFGGESGGDEPPDKTATSLNGVTKIVTRQHGTTGLFQYFIKIVPTTYKGGQNNDVETNRYFFTERFRPLMKEYLEEEEEDVVQKDKPDDKTTAVQAGHAGGHAHHNHHNIKNAVLPGVFFIYEIYPFAVEVSKNNVPFLHLLIRLMATIGGVFTIVRWADSLIEAKRKTSFHTG